MRMKKFLTILLTFAMVLGLLPTAAFAANNTATTMRLAKTEGTVTVTNSTEKAVTQTTNMKLYNGYKVKTAAKSYGWISLDDTKVAKLDANSGTEVQKSGQKLTLYLSSGNIFFNVKDPLKSGESFHIKTSTMTTGIRGTSGCVRVINDRVSEIHLLTGQVEVYVEDPLTGVTATAVLKAGQKATSMIDHESMAATGKEASIVISPLTGEEVCGNCAKEIAADPALADRIRREAPHLLPEEIAAAADKKLAADEAAADAKLAKIEQAEASQEFPEDVDPYFEQSTGGGGGGGSSSGGSGGGNNDEKVTVPVDTWGDLSDYIDRVNNGEKIDEIKLTQDISGKDEADTLPPIKSGESLTLNLGTSTLTLNDTLVNNGDLTITNDQGYITADITAYEDHGYTNPELIRNNGTLTQEDGILILPDHFDACIAVMNTGTYNLEGGGIHNGEGNGANAVKNQDGGVFNMSGGTIDFTGGGRAIENYATMNLSGEAEINISGEYGYAIYNWGTGTLNMTGGTINVGLEATGIYNGSDTEYDENDDPITILGTVNVDGASAKIVGENGYIPEDDIAPYLATLVMNAGAFELANGTLSVGDYGYGLVSAGDDCITRMVGGTVEVAGADSTGFILDNGTNSFIGGAVEATGADAVGLLVRAEASLTGTEIIAESRSMQQPTGVWILDGGEMIFFGGSVTAEATEINGEMYFATAVRCDSEDCLAEKPDENGVKWPIKTTVRAKAADEVFPVGNDAIAPAGYEVKDDTANSGYFVLIDPNNPSDPDIGGDDDDGEDGDGDDDEIIQADTMYVEGYGDFIRALLEFNSGSKNMIIFFNHDDAITDEVIAMVAEEFGMDDIGKVKVDNDDATLIIDLNGYNLDIRSTSLNTQENGGLLNNGSLIIKDSSDDETGTITGTTASLIENRGTFELQGGTITISADTTYRAVENVGEMTMSGGVINVTKGDGIDLHGDADLTMDGGTINVTGSGTAIYDNASGILKLKGGRIIVKDVTAFGISVSDGTGQLTLTNAIVKGVDGDNLLSNSCMDGFKVVGPDGDGYYRLVVDSGSGEGGGKDDGDGTDPIVPVKVDSWTEFVETVNFFNLEDEPKTIVLEGDITPTDYEKTNVVLAPIGDGGTNTSTLTIDVGEYDLNLVSRITVAETGSLKITGTTGAVVSRESAIITNNGDFELDGGELDGYINQIVQNNGEMTMTGGTITADEGMYAIMNQGTVTMTGGVINVNYAYSGTGIHSGDEINFGGTARINVNTPNSCGIFNATTTNITGGSIEVYAVPAAAIDGYGGTLNMSGGEICLHVCSDTDSAYGITDVSKVNLSGDARIEMDDDLKDETDNLNYGIYLKGSSAKVNLKGGEIEMYHGYGVGVSTVSNLTLKNAVVKGLNADKLLVTADADETGFTAAGPDAQGYYTLKAEDKGPSQAEMDEALYIFAENLLVYNMRGGNTTVSLKNDVAFDNDVLMQIKHFADILAELGHDELAVWGSGGSFTIDLKGNDLILESTLLIGNYSDVKIIDSEGGGKIRGSAMQEMFILSDGASLTLNGVAMEVAEEGQIGIDYRSTGALTFTETATMTVKGESAFGIIAQGFDLTVPEGCIIVEGEGAEGILQ